VHVPKRDINSSSALARFESNRHLWTCCSVLLTFKGHLLLLDVHSQLSCTFAAPGPALETFVGEDVNTMLIVNLLSGTEYSVKVIASYTTGSSEALSGRAKTCKFIILFSELKLLLRSVAVGRKCWLLTISAYILYRFLSKLPVNITYKLCDGGLWNNFITLKEFVILW